VIRALSLNYSALSLKSAIIGLVYADQGKLTEAEEMYERALTGYEKALGLDHTSTLQTVNNLGNLYIHQGTLKEAEEMYYEAWKQLYQRELRFVLLAERQNSQ
jgi:tetratricopeptide (TPR) repeat protein